MKGFGNIECFVALEIGFAEALSRFFGRYCKGYIMSGFTTFRMATFCY